MIKGPEIALEEDTASLPTEMVRFHQDHHKVSVQLHPLKKLQPQLWCASEAWIAFFSCLCMLPSRAATAAALSAWAVVGAVRAAHFDEHQILREWKVAATWASLSPALVNGCCHLAAAPGSCSPAQPPASSASSPALKEVC